MNTSDSEPTEPSPANETAMDPMEAALRQAAQAADNGEEVNNDALLEASAKHEAGNKTAGNDAGKKPTASERSERKTDTDPAKKDGKDEGKKDTTKPEDKKTEGKEDSKFEKARKETERFDRNWKKLQEQAEQIKQREAALVERERALAQGGQQHRSSEPLKDKLGYTAKQYEEAATAWEAAGKFDLADEAKAAAKALREQEKAGAQQSQRTATQTQPQDARPPEMIPGTEQFTAKWKGHVEELKASEEYKDLGNKESELFKATHALLQGEPRLSQFNDGIRIAAEIAKLRIEAGSVSVLRTQIAEANKELEKLRKATSPGAGETESRGAGAKSFESMTPAEQEAHIKRAAAEVDAA